MHPRRLTQDSFPPYSLRDGPATLILIPCDEPIMFANNRGNKDELIARWKPTSGTLLWPWVGQFRTDVFELTPEDIKKYYRKEDYEQSYRSRPL